MQHHNYALSDIVQSSLDGNSIDGINNMKRVSGLPTPDTCDDTFISFYNN